MGKCFPDANSLSDITLLIAHMIREMVGRGELEPDIQDIIYIPENKFLDMIETCKKTYQNGFVKMYREMTAKEFCRVIMEYLLQMELIERKDGSVKIHAAFCRVVGVYPGNFET